MCVCRYLRAPTQRPILYLEEKKALDWMNQFVSIPSSAYIDQWCPERVLWPCERACTSPCVSQCHILCSVCICLYYKSKDRPPELDVTNSLTLMLADWSQSKCCLCVCASLVSVREAVAIIFMIYLHSCLCGVYLVFRNICVYFLSTNTRAQLRARLKHI